MKLKASHASERTKVSILLGSIATLLITLPMATTVLATSSVVSTNSSANCENNDSLFSSSFSCSLSVTAGSTIVVFLGCLSGLSSPCDSVSVVDSQGNKYSYLSNVETSCDGDTCAEYALWAAAASTGVDELTYSTASHAYLGGDAYDVAGVNGSSAGVKDGGSSMNSSPTTIEALTPEPGSFVVAGVIANDAAEFTAGAGYTLIPGQPCYPCGNVGGWQGSEYQVWGNHTGPTVFDFIYLSANDGWAELGVSFAPNVATESVTCTPSPVAVTMASKCTATVRGDSPTGTVMWSANETGKFSSTSCTLSSGACSVSYTPSVPSAHITVAASYGGDSNNPGASGSFALSAPKDATTTVVMCSPSPVSTGSPTTCAASVSGASPTGTITWASSGLANFSPATTCTLSAGSCAVDYTPSSATASLTITGIYSGDNDNNGSMGAFSLSVSAASSTTSTSTSTSTTVSSSSATSTSTPTSATTSSSTSTPTSTSTSRSTSTPSPTSSSGSASSSTIASTSAHSSSSSIVATTTSTPTSTASSVASSTSATGSTSSSGSSGGGVPVFPYQLGVAALFTGLLCGSYLLIRKRTVPKIRV
ncbi:MAG: hypothetical protein OK456_01355 [Thaumarchaeota archaeon]|nr:hypothetical protein [Nitrososphaerota archaeon]